VKSVAEEVAEERRVPRVEAEEDEAGSPLSSSAARRGMLIPLVVGSAFFMEGLDSTIIAVSIPDMAKSLGESPLRLSLVITTYLISLAVFIPVSGWIADRYGTRRVFCAAIATFALGSALCGFADGLPTLVAMRVLQGFGGAMMTPVGRLILLRSFPRSRFVTAMNYMTIPAMIGPTVGPIIGGFLTTYASWRWIFYVNIPMGLLGVVMSWRLVEDFRAPAPLRFDVTGFFIVGIGLACLEFAIENVGRPVVPPVFGIVFFSAALVLLLLYRRHARRTDNPVLDLSLFRVRTFRIGTASGSVCRMGLDAVPFLLPLLFQVGFGLSALQSGLLAFTSSLGAMLVRTYSRALLRLFGFRRLLIGNACLAAVSTAGFALLGPATPAAVIAGCVFVSGCLRSIQYLGLNTISYADVPSHLLSRSTSVGGVAQQLARGFGVALGASLLALVAGGESVGAGDFRVVLALIALIPLVSVLGFRGLGPLDGAEVSGNRRSAAG
jgi:EmrB/QacA subfamily drug resistance transporter